MPHSPLVLSLSKAARVGAEEGEVRTIFLALACWNTAVAVVNTTVLPWLEGPGITGLMTPASQVIPVAIPLMVWVALNLQAHAHV